MNLTLEEQERAAYMRGDTAQAKLLGELIDAEAAAENALDEAESAHQDGYSEGYADGVAEAQQE